MRMTCGLRAQTVHGRVEADVTKEKFALRFRSPGRYALSVRRLGYRPAELSVRVSASDTTITVRLSPVPLRLQAIATRSRGQCRLRPTSDSTLWAMWSDAELAMLNARVASGGEEYRFDAEFFERTYSISSAKISDMSFQDTAIVGGRPWVSLSADSLDHAGFVSATANDMTFVGPDLDALLSPAFLDNHCFSVHPGALRDSSLVGLDFAPTSASRHIDIRGTFWLERSTAELRALTFNYDKLPFAGSDTLAGGRIEFARISSGAWVLTHWSIRMPRASLLYLRTTAAAAYRAKRVVNATDPRFGAVTMTVTGGSVRAVRYEGTSQSSILWTAPVSTLTVHVREQNADSTYAVAEGDIVRLRGSTRQATTDKDGNAVFPNMLPGVHPGSNGARARPVGASTRPSCRRGEGAGTRQCRRPCDVRSSRHPHRVRRKTRSRRWSGVRQSHSPWTGLRRRKDFRRLGLPRRKYLSHFRHTCRLRRTL